MCFFFFFFSVFFFFNATATTEIYTLSLHDALPISALQASLIIGIALAIGVNFPNPIMIIPIMGIVILFSLGFSGISVMVAATAKSQETFWGVINFLGMPDRKTSCRERV